MDEILIQIRDLLKFISIMCGFIMTILVTDIFFDFITDLVNWIQNKRKKSKSKV